MMSSPRTRPRHSSSGTLSWTSGFVWQLVTYPVVGVGAPTIWILLELFVLFWFARDVLSRIPEPFAGHLSDIVLLVEEFADDETLDATGMADPFEMTGLYHGSPIGDKSAFDGRRFRQHKRAPPGDPRAVGPLARRSGRLRRPVRSAQPLRAALVRRSGGR